MNLKGQLLADLIELRRDSGLTPKRLDTLSTLRQRVGGQTKEEAAERLKALVAMIGDRQERQAVANAFGLIGGRESKLNLRRKAISQEWKRSIKTIERKENSGLEDLAQIILEHSGEGDHQIAASKRIADLETTVSVLARMLMLHLLSDMPSHRRKRVMQSLEDDHEAYARSMAKILWRGSDSGRWAIGVLLSEFLDDLVDEEIEAPRLLDYIKPLDSDLPKILGDDSTESRDV